MNTKQITKKDYLEAVNTYKRAEKELQELQDRLQAQGYATERERSLVWILAGYFTDASRDVKLINRKYNANLTAIKDGQAVDIEAVRIQDAYYRIFTDERINKANGYTRIRWINKDNN